MGRIHKGIGKNELNYMITKMTHQRETGHGHRHGHRAYQILGRLCYDQEYRPDPNLEAHDIPSILDDFEVYDGDIERLYQNVCQKDNSNMLYCLKGMQLGIVGKDDLHAAIRGEKTLNIDEISQQVRELSPDFENDVGDSIPISTRQEGLPISCP